MLVLERRNKNVFLLLVRTLAELKELLQGHENRKPCQLVSTTVTLRLAKVLALYGTLKPVLIFSRAGRFLPVLVHLQKKNPLHKKKDI